MPRLGYMSTNDAGFTSAHGYLKALRAGTGNSVINYGGWTVGTTAAGNFSALDAGTTVRAAATFGATNPCDGTPDTVLGDCLRNQFPLWGTFAAGTWTIQLSVLANTAYGAAGRVNVRLLKGTMADGSNAVEFGGGLLIGTEVTNLDATTTQHSVATAALNTVTFTGEFLFVQLAWEITAAATNTAAAVNIRLGPANTGVDPTAFTPARTHVVEYTVGPSNRNYTSLGAAAAAFGRDLTVFGERVDVRMFAMTDTNRYVMAANIACDMAAGYYPRVFADESARHGGAWWTTGAVTLQTNHAYGFFALAANSGIVLEDLQLENTNVYVGGDQRGVLVWKNDSSNSSQFFADRCLFKKTNLIEQANADAIQVATGSGSQLRFRNCGFSGFYDTFEVYGGLIDLVIENCTVLGAQVLGGSAAGGIGWNLSGGVTAGSTLTVRNTYSGYHTGNALASVHANWTTTFQNNASDDATASGTGAVPNVTPTFQDLPQLDLRYAAADATGLATAGANLSGSFTTDIGRRPRSAWGIGCGVVYTEAAHARPAGTRRRRARLGGLSPLHPARAPYQVRADFRPLYRRGLEFAWLLNNLRCPSSGMRAFHLSPGGSNQGAIAISRDGPVVQLSAGQGMSAGYGSAPTTESTMVLRYRKTDTTARANGTGLSVTSGTGRYLAAIGTTGNLVTWEVGGTTEGATRLSKSWTPDTEWHTWVFTHGPRGMEIWLDGVLWASNAATPTCASTSTSNSWRLLSAISGDAAQVGAWLVATRQWSADEIRRVTQDPYGVFRRQDRQGAGPTRDALRPNGWFGYDTFVATAGTDLTAHESGV